MPSGGADLPVTRRAVRPMARRLSNYLVAFAFAAPAAARCEVLRSLEFQQHTAPKGVSELLGPVMSLVSEVEKAPYRSPFDSPTI